MAKLRNTRSGLQPPGHAVDHREVTDDELLRAFDRAGGPLGVRELSERTQLRPAAALEAVARLQRAEVLIAVGYDTDATGRPVGPLRYSPQER